MTTKKLNNSKWLIVVLATLAISVIRVDAQTCTSYEGATKDTQTTITSSNAASGSAGKISWSGNGTCSSSQWRFAASKSVTFTAASGYNITSIVFTSTSSPNYYGTWTSSPSVTPSVSGGTTTFSGLNANSVTLTTSTAARMKTCVVTYASSCSNSVTINKGGETNGTFTLSKSGAQASCDGVSVTVAASPNTNYYVSSVTESGASASPTITGSGNSWTVAYAANTTGTSTISVTFALKTLYTVKWYNEGTEITGLASGLTSVYSGDKVTGVPSNPSSSCSGEFIGWVKSDAAVADKSVTDAYTTQPTAPTLFTDVAGSPTITGNTAFHAVYRMPKPD